MIEPSARIEGLEEYYFSTKLKQIREMDLTGEPVINLGVGSPDQAPEADVIEELAIQARDEKAHGYQPYQGISDLRKAFAGWYSRSYGAELDPESQILPLFGSKEGLMHIAMSFLSPGDAALVPDPGYPAYAAVTRLAGAKVITYPLLPENNWLPDLNFIELLGLHQVKVMWVNFPHMPTGKRATKELFEELVAFAKYHKILLVNDNPYSFILNDQPISLLAVPDAIETSLELNSLSKSHNMAGWRIGMVAGRKEYLDYLMRFKSQMDSGMFKPMQLAAIKALEAGPAWYEGINSIYRERKVMAYALLEKLKCTYDKDQSGLFVWAQIPSIEASGQSLADRILLEKRVFITPGFIFGPQGDQYIRVSLCQPKEVISSAIDRINGKII
ncbi:MAG: aminotransferase class I/II-fold pyridoxal phosphate-dependent enzyme [Porphyromonadaceae bacterium]|nr:MAG: aminotransferase class I/II-fold pyridoxal phosphate-dependent enzyme [Porphyromonadaceae bacterium]